MEDGGSTKWASYSCVSSLLIDGNDLGVVLDDEDVADDSDDEEDEDEL